MYEGIKNLSPKQLAKNILAKVQQKPSQSDEPLSQESTSRDLRSAEVTTSTHTEESSVPHASQEENEQDSIYSLSTPGGGEALLQAYDAMGVDDLIEDQKIDYAQKKYWEYFTEKYGRERASELLPHNLREWKPLISISPEKYDQQPKELDLEDMLTTKATSLRDLRQKLEEKYHHPALKEAIDHMVNTDDLSEELVDSYMKSSTDGQSVQEVYNDTAGRYEALSQANDELELNELYEDQKIDNAYERYREYFTEKYGRERTFELLPDYYSREWKQLLSVRPEKYDEQIMSKSEVLSQQYDKFNIDKDLFQADLMISQSPKLLAKLNQLSQTELENFNLEKYLASLPPKELKNYGFDINLEDSFDTDTLETIIQRKDKKSFNRYLKFVAQFPKYSSRNQRLLYEQAPNAQQVASRQQWQNLGNSVKKDAQALYILATVTSVKKDRDGQPILDENGQKQHETYEKRVPVFDQTQVTDPQKIFQPIKPIEGNLDSRRDPERFEKAMQIVSGLTTAKVILGKMPTNHRKDNGYFNAEQNIIVLKHGLSQNQTVHTLLHEVVHSRLHQNEMVKFGSVNHQRSEFVAESVAFILAERLGLDTKKYRFGYLDSWQHDDPKFEKIAEVFQQISEEAKTLSGQIEQRIAELQKHSEHQMKMQTVPQPSLTKIKEATSDKKLNQAKGPKM